MKKGNCLTAGTIRRVKEIRDAFSILYDGHLRKAEFDKVTFMELAYLSDRGEVKAPVRDVICSIRL